MGEKWLAIGVGELVFHNGAYDLAWRLPQFPLKNNPVQRWTPVAEVFSETELYRKCVLTFASGEVRLYIEIRAYVASAMIRMRYSLAGDAFCGLDGENRVFYGALSASAKRWTELQLGQFDRITHCFIPDERTWEADALARRIAGPLALACEHERCALLAYEHGAEQPEHFLEIELSPSGMALYSAKGNFYNGQQAEDYLAPWIELGARANAQEMRAAFREFMLREIAGNSASRMPYIFYNTWHFQEGRKYLLGNSVLKDINEEFILADIDRAHALGVEVYVIDTGWYQKTGEWTVNERFFPSGMKRVRERLDNYGMMLGLWFNPIVAARTSEIFIEHPEYVITKDGIEQYQGRIWETEESYGMCLDTEYADWFVKQLIRLYDELGVRYFKWDAVSQWGCDSALHNHGGKANSARERAEAYAYRMGLKLIHVVEKLTEACPDAIVDFDVTEGGRFMGLGFLSAGKYFLVNNGPYFYNFDIPSTVKISPDTINVFFHPGPARAQVCRQNIRYDRFIPSILFLTHYLPHGDACSDANNQAALALGGNGIWGYLNEMKPDSVERWARFIKQYKRVRAAATKAYPIFEGAWGTSPEIIEKLDEDSGRGFVIFFTHAAGEFTYRTRALNAAADSIDGCDTSRRLPDGSYVISVKLEADDARTVFFL